MSDLNQLAGYYKRLPYCYGDDATEEERRKGIHNEKMERVYPAFPWKWDGSDHFNDDPRYFSALATKYGLINHLTREHWATGADPLISYKQWVELHKDDPNWVNNIGEDNGIRNEHD